MEARSGTATGPDHEIADFTIVTEWEQLLHDLEKFVRTMETAAKDVGAAGSTNRSVKAEVGYKSALLEVSLESSAVAPLVASLPNFRHDARATGPGELWTVFRAFDIDSFLLLRPSETANITVSLSTAHMLLSSLLIAARESSYSSDIPCFVEYGEGGEYLGNLMDIDTTISFGICQKPKNAELCGPLDVAITSAFGETKYSDLGISAAAQYVWDTESEEPLRPRLAGLDKDDLMLGWGHHTTPITLLRLDAIWPNLESEALIVQNLLPFSAPIWLLSYSKSTDFSSLQLSSLLVALCRLKELSDVPQPSALFPINSKSKVRDLERGATPRISGIFGTSFAARPFDPTSYLRYALFGSNGQPEAFSYRLVKCVIAIFAEYNGPDYIFTNNSCDLSAISLFWKELVATLRCLYEANEPIPDVPAKPDLSMPLLFQKLAMLNYCIERSRLAGMVPPKRSAFDMQELLQPLSDKHASDVKTAREKTAIVRMLRKTTAAVQSAAGKNADPDGRSSLPEMLDHLASSSVKSKAKEAKNSVVDGKGKENEQLTDEEFYDALELDPEMRSLILADIDDSANTIRQSISPEGRLGPFKTHRLLSNPEVRVYEPIVQEICPLTSDYQQAYEFAFTRIDHAADSAGEQSTKEPFRTDQIKARLQCAQLVSDMEAFKAANPDAQLGDFVRWHSPRDWLVAHDKAGEESAAGDVDNGLQGELSSRMKDPNGLWLELWNTCGAVPAARQKPLYNVVAEAERCLHYVEELSLAEFLEQGWPCLLHILSDSLPCSNDDEVEAHKRIRVAIRDGQMDGAINELFSAEYNCSLRKCISELLEGLEEVSANLYKACGASDCAYSAGSVLISDEADREAIAALFQRRITSCAMLVFTNTLDDALRPIVEEIMMQSPTNGNTTDRLYLKRDGQGIAIGKPSRRCKDSQGQAAGRLDLMSDAKRLAQLLISGMAAGALIEYLFYKSNYYEIVKKKQAGEQQLLKPLESKLM